MASMAIYYRPPEDAETFEKRYLSEHLPLVDRYEHVKERRFAKVTRSLVGDFPYAYVFVAHWDDADGMKADLNSAAAKDALDNAKQVAPQGFDVVLLDWLA